MGKIGEDGQDIYTSSYKINHSRGCSVHCGDYS